MQPTQPIGPNDPFHHDDHTNLHPLADPHHLGMDSHHHGSADDHHHLVFGDPLGDMRYWHRQSGDYNCAVEAQNGILECLTGEKIPEMDAAVESAQLGLLTTSGTMPDHIGGWLESHGIECHSRDNGTFMDVIQELRDGNKVIVGVDSDSLWHSHDAFHAFANQAKDHAIWLTGVDASDPHHVKVTINDSGKADGAGNVYDLHELQDVLNCPGFHYVATGHGPLHLPEHPAGYDPRDGIFHGLDQFLHDHAFAIAGVAATAVLASAALRMPLPSVAPSPSGPDRNVQIGCEPTRPQLPPPPLKLEDLSREERDRVLRGI